MKAGVRIHSVRAAVGASRDTVWSRNSTVKGEPQPSRRDLTASWISAGGRSKRAARLRCSDNTTLLRRTTGPSLASLLLAGRRAGCRNRTQSYQQGAESNANDSEGKAVGETFVRPLCYYSTGTGTIAMYTHHRHDPTTSQTITLMLASGFPPLAWVPILPLQTALCLCAHASPVSPQSACAPTLIQVLSPPTAYVHTLNLCIHAAPPLFVASLTSAPLASAAE